MKYPYHQWCGGSVDCHCWQWEIYYTSHIPTYHLQHKIPQYKPPSHHHRSCTAENTSCDQPCHVINHVTWSTTSRDQPNQPQLWGGIGCSNGLPGVAAINGLNHFSICKSLSIICAIWDRDIFRIKRKCSAVNLVPRPLPDFISQLWRKNDFSL